MSKIGRAVMIHLPIILSGLIAVAFSWDLPLLAPLKTEQSFGWWVVVLAPLAVILGLVQIAIWALVFARRMPRRDTKRS